MNTEQERADFEAWYAQEYNEPVPSEFSPQGFYPDKRVQLLFRCWCAGRSALQSQDREDSERLDFITGEDSKWSVMRQKVGDKPTRYKMRYDGELVGPWFNTAREAIDHARRIEGGGE